MRPGWRSTLASSSRALAAGDRLAVPARQDVDGAGGVLDAQAQPAQGQRGHADAEEADLDPLHGVFDVAEDRGLSQRPVVEQGEDGRPPGAGRRRGRPACRPSAGPSGLAGREMLLIHVLLCEERPAREIAPARPRS